MSNNLIKEIKALLILVSAFVLVLLLIIYSTQIFTNEPLRNNFLKGLSIYLLLLMLSYLIKKTFKRNLYVLIYNIIHLPIAALYLLLTFIIPICIIISHIAIYIALAFAIPQLIYLVISFFYEHLISQQTHLYLLITMAVFIMVLFNSYLRRFVHIISPARFKDSEKLRPYQLEKLSKYVLEEENIRFIVYSLYISTLLYINIINFQVGAHYMTLFEDPVLQSFVTFISFDSALAILKKLKFKPSIFLKMLITSVKNKINSLGD